MKTTAFKAKLHPSLLAFCLVVLSTPIKAQKEDYIWLSGYDSWVGYDTFTHALYGTSVLNFNYAPMDTSYDTLKMNFDATNTSYCSANGSLLFYTNGIYIANSLDEKVESSDSMNAGYVQFVFDPNIHGYGYRNAQGILAFQNNSDSNQYYFIHTLTDSVLGTGGSNLYYSKVLVTLLDISANGGHGKVLYKDQTLIRDSIGFNLSATRHANGRDWWILVSQHYTNCYYRILLDPAGPHVIPGLICGGQQMIMNDIGNSCFSPDGRKKVCMLLYRFRHQNF